MFTGAVPVPQMQQEILSVQTRSGAVGALTGVIVILVALAIAIVSNGPARRQPNSRVLQTSS
jgi:hypothetical protein